MRAIFFFVIIAITAAAAPSALSATLTEAGEDVSIDAEEWTPQAGTVTTLEQSNLNGVKYKEDVLVRDTNGDRVYENDDYIWFESNGTVKTVTGGQLDGQNSATIDYGYQDTTAETRGFADMFVKIPNVVGLALPIFAILFLLTVVRG